MRITGKAWPPCGEFSGAAGSAIKDRGSDPVASSLLRASWSRKAEGEAASLHPTCPPVLLAQVTVAEILLHRPRSAPPLGAACSAWAPPEEAPSLCARPPVLRRARDSDTRRRV